MVKAPIRGKDGLMKITHVKKDTTTWKRRARAGQVFSKEAYAQAVGEKRKKEVEGNGGVHGDQGKKGKRQGVYVMGDDGKNGLGMGVVNQPRRPQ